MRFRVRKTAHIFERVGLAMAGAACGLFVGAYVGSAISALTTQGFLLLMMLLGFVGFYLGIDTPQLPFDDAHSEIDAAEFLSAAGTLCATLTALASVAVIVLRLDPHRPGPGSLCSAGSPASPCRSSAARKRGCGSRRGICWRTSVLRARSPLPLAGEVAPKARVRERTSSAAALVTPASP